MIKYLVLGINNKKKQFPQDISPLRHPPLTNPPPPPPPVTSFTV